MDYIIKEQNPVVLSKAPLPPTRYEFYEPVTTKDVNDVDVVIPKLVGSYTIDELNKQRATLEASLADVIAKIDAITKV